MPMQGEGVVRRSYKIFETAQFLKDLQLLARSGHKQIEEKLRRYVYPQLREEPHFGLNIKRLRDFVPPTWRYRVGRWRFFYITDDAKEIVSMISASHRKEAYR